MIACGGFKGCINHIVYEVEGEANTKIDHKRGVFYCLPRTVIVAQTDVTQSTLAPGRFIEDLNKDQQSINAKNNYQAMNQTQTTTSARTLTPQESSDRDQYKVLADLLQQLGIHNFADKPTVPFKYQMTKPTITSRSESDPTKLYLIEIQGGPLQDRSLKMTFNDNNVPTSASSSGKDRTVDIAVKTVETAAGIIGKFIAFAGPPSSRTNVIAIDKAIQVAEKIQSIRTKRQELYDQAADPNAQYDPQVFQMLLDNLNAQEKALIAYFQVEQTTTWNGAFEVRPQQQKAGPDTYSLFTFDSEYGLTLNAANPPLIAPPVNFNIAQPTTATRSKEVKLTVDIARVLNNSPLLADRLTGRTFDSECKSTKLGWRYRVPVHTMVTITSGTQTVASSKVLVAQLGPVLALPKGVNSSDFGITVTLNGDTGALMTVDVASKAMDPATIDAAGKAINATIDASNPLNVELAKIKAENDLAYEANRKKKLDAGELVK